MTRRTFLLLAGAASAAAQDFKMPLAAKSVRFAIIGDFGTGGKEQYQVAQQMATFHNVFPFEFVLTMGDNLYGGESAKDFKRKFEDPYKPLLDAGIKFYAALGNHDNPNQRFYKPFNMEGRRFYDFRRGNAAFFAMDSNYMSPEQIDWLKKELSESDAPWKICYFHHPLFSHAKMHGSDTDLRKVLVPIFQQYGVRVVLAGHEHVYERLRPQGGIDYFVLGNSGELRMHDLRPSPDTAKGFDTDRCFAMFEIAGDVMYYQVVSRSGATVDAGTTQLPVADRSTVARPLKGLLLVEQTRAANALALEHHQRNSLGGGDIQQRISIHQ